VNTMVEKRTCSFCGEDIEPGTGMLFVRRDGTRLEFCSSKCRRNMLDLKRVPRRVKWTKSYVKGGGKVSAAAATAASLASKAPDAAPKAAPKKAKAAAKPAAAPAAAGAKAE